MFFCCTAKTSGFFPGGMCHAIKVYGDAPNELPLKELKTRWEYSDPADFDGINESMRIDQCKHSIFGADKVAADVMVQECGRYFDMKTVAANSARE